MPATRILRRLLALALAVPMLLASFGSTARATKVGGEATTFTDLVYKEVDGIPLTLDAYLPRGRYSPSILLIHGGGWAGGDKGTESVRKIADAMRSRGIAVFAVNYRLTCWPEAADPEVSDPRLCVGPGHGTIGTVNEPYLEVRDALLWVLRYVS